jgi:predicted DNA-binding transcriptional regulator AlpA
MRRSDKKVSTDVRTRLWGTAEVSDYLGISVNTLYQWRTRHYGPPGRRVGRHLRYRPAEVVAWFDALDPEAA